jgi:hypothetical protein
MRESVRPSRLDRSPKKPHRRWLWIGGVALAVILIPTAIIAIPIITHVSKGVPIQEDSGQQWPLSATTRGGDERTRTVIVAAASAGSALDTSALTEGQRLVVSGTGFDSAQGIYVAICVIPDDPATKPGPCLGGVPTQTQQDVAAGTVQFAPSNWINDDWAWKLFGSRGYDDPNTGSFTAYLEIPSPVGEGIDCTVSKCAIYTRNDHTALRDRAQDVYLPVGFAD